MSKEHLFERDELLPSYFVNAQQEFASGARTDLRLSRKNSTTVQVVPDAVLGIASIAIEGFYRWNTATVERIHPGGAKGTYTVWAVAEANDIDDSPDPKTDHTDRSFELSITSGAEPTGEGIDLVEKIGEIDWSGSAIEAIRQTYSSVTGAMLGDDVLDGGGDLEWVRQPGGGFLPELKAGIVTSREAQLTAGVVPATGNLLLTTSYQDVPGAELEITPAVASILKVTAVFDLQVSNEGEGLTASVGSVKLNADAEQTRLARVMISDTTVAGQIKQHLAARQTVAEVYALALTAAKHTIKLRAKREGAEGAGVGDCFAVGTAFLYELIAA